MNYYILGLAILTAIVAGVVLWDVYNDDIDKYAADAQRDTHEEYAKAHKSMDEINKQLKDLLHIMQQSR